MSRGYNVVAIDTEGECFDLYRLAKENHAELAGHLPFDDKWTLAQALKIAQSDKTTVNAWVIYCDGEAVGYFVGSISQYLFNSEQRANQEIWYISKEYRNGRASYLLFQAFEEWAISRGCIEITSGASMESAEGADRVAMLFPRMGYKRVGSVFNKLVEI